MRPAAGTNLSSEGRREISFTYCPRFACPCLPPAPRPLTESCIQVPSLRARLRPELSLASPSPALLPGFINAAKSSLPMRVRRISSGMQLNAMTARCRAPYWSRAAITRRAFSSSVRCMMNTRSASAMSRSAACHVSRSSAAPQL
jgi:hypothetical protein